MPTLLANFSDKELAARALAGSAACYEEIVRRHQVPLIRFLARRFPSRRDAEDILQETFLKAWQSLHRFDPQYEFRTWLYTIAYRLAVSRGRRVGTEEALPTYDLRNADPAPASRIEREDDHHSIWNRAREVLSEEQYTALWLHYVDDIPAGDIARILNRSWVSVKTLMHSARKKLMPHLTEQPALALVAARAMDERPTLKAGEP